MLKLGASKNKLVLGLPLYGRTFILPEPLTTTPVRKPKLGAVAKNFGFQGQFTRENGFMGYNEVCIYKTQDFPLYQHLYTICEVSRLFLKLELRAVFAKMIINYLRLPFLAFCFCSSFSSHFSSLPPLLCSLFLVHYMYRFMDMQL